MKGYRFIFFVKNIGKNISKHLSLKYRQKLFDRTKQSATNAIKTSSKKTIQKTAGAADDLICKKIANRIIKVKKKKIMTIIRDSYECVR